MKLTGLLCVMLLVGCSTSAYDQYRLPYDQLANIRLQCSQQDYLYKLLDDQDRQHSDDAKYHSMARSKIWQLRTYCQGSEVAKVGNVEPILTDLATVTVSKTSIIPGRSICRYESVTEKSADTVNNRSVENCVEDSSLKVEPIRIGSLIYEAQVEPHPHVNHYFVYKNNRCRWFFESGTAHIKGDLVAIQGIICYKPTFLKWAVVDIF